MGNPYIEFIKKFRQKNPKFSQKEAIIHIKKNNLYKKGQRHRILHEMDY